VPDSSDIRLPATRTVAVIGGGPAGLMAAEVLARAGATVTVYDRMPSLGRKFLLAGRGGLNLTHSEDLKPFLGRYGDDIDPKLRAAIEAYPPQALRAWSDSLGQETFIGSSGRVFPVALKTSPLLRTWSSCAIAGTAGTTKAGCALPGPMANRSWRPMRPCWRLAAPAGRGSAPMAPGSRRWPRTA